MVASRQLAVLLAMSLAPCSAADTGDAAAAKVDSVAAAPTAPDVFALQVQTVSAPRSLFALQPAIDGSDTEARSIGDIRPSLDYAWGDVESESLPDNFAVNTDDTPMSRVIGTPLLLQWQASNIWYHPLYFEDGPLERYGHTYNRHIQYVLSPVKFLGQTALLPYNATLRPHDSREYPLGWYRPGECTPHLKYKKAWNNHAAVNEALAVVGLVFLIP